MPDLFASPAMAAGYARARPAVHPQVSERVWGRLGLAAPVARALDVGCGAGLSTAPLVRIAQLCVGIDPVEAMVQVGRRHSDQVVLGAARAEALPIAARSIDVITAAGSLNYVQLDTFFPEALRVLRSNGALVVYDFSAGRRFRSSPALDEWFTEFVGRYPRAQGVARPLDPDSVAVAAKGFRLVGSERFVVTLRLTFAFYLDYVMTETNVSHAIQSGTSSDEIRSWCAESLGVVFGDHEHEVQFDGYLAHLTPA